MGQYRYLKCISASISDSEKFETYLDEAMHALNSAWNFSNDKLLQDDNKEFRKAYEAL
jgi:hypothetical protein